MRPSVTAQLSKIEKNGIDVYKTNDYSLFKKAVGNRPLRQALVNKIYQSICDFGWMDSSIIIVGEGMRVLDGQHRIAALKKYKEDTGIAPKVRYVVDRNLDNIKKIQAFNENKATWNAMDYLDSYVAQGNQHYADYRNFMEEYKLNHTSAMSIVMPEKSGHAKFKAGRFVCSNWDIHKVRAQRINDLVKLFKYAKTYKFVRAIMFCWQQPEFDHKKFVKKLEMDREMLYRVGSIAQYVQLIENVYNYHAREKVRFDF